jgi:hypothetical protein
MICLGEVTQRDQVALPMRSVHIWLNLTSPATGDSKQVTKSGIRSQLQWLPHPCPQVAPGRRAENSMIKGCGEAYGASPDGVAPANAKRVSDFHTLALEMKEYTQRGSTSLKWGLGRAAFRTDVIGANADHNSAKGPQGRRKKPLPIGERFRQSIGSDQAANLQLD